MTNINGEYTDCFYPGGSSNYQVNLPLPTSQNSFGSLQWEGDRVLLLQRILETQQNIFANQEFIYSKLLGLEQRLNSEQPIRAASPPAELSETTNAWFKMNFQVMGFETNLCKNQIGTDYPFNLPVILKQHNIKSLQISLKWIREDATISEKQDEIIEKVKKQMKLFLKNYQNGILQYHSDIPQENVNVVLTPPSTVGIVLNLRTDLPLTLTHHSFLCFGLAENKDSQPAILLQDVLVISKIGKNRFSANKTDDMLARCLSNIYNVRHRFVSAFWYNSMLKMAEEYENDADDFEVIEDLDSDFQE